MQVQNMMEYLENIAATFMLDKVEMNTRSEYPFVDVKHYREMCNHNTFDILLKEKAKFFSWTNTSDKINIIDNPHFPLGGIT